MAGTVPDAAAFVGRGDALAVLAEARVAAERGQPQLVVIEGAPGVGKSTLVDHFLASNSSDRVISARGAESETLDRFAVAGELLRGLRVAFDGKFEPAIEPADDVTDVGGRLLSVLGSDPSFTILVLDDAQWADAASVRALAFALRRLESDAVLTIVSARPAGMGGELLTRLVEAATGSTVHLEGLTIPEVRQLAAARGVNLTVAAARRLQAHTGGLPLHVNALLRELDPAVLGRAHGPLPAPRSFANLILHRLSHASPDVEALVAAAAVLGTRTQLSLAAEIAGLADPVDALDGAVRDGLLEHRWDPAGDEIRFPHDLIHASVLEGLGPARRVALHRRAAARLDGLAALEQRAAATMGRDADIALRLEHAARTEAAQGAVELAVHHYLEASRVHPDPETARSLRLDALETLVLAGEVERANGLALDLHADLDTGTDRARSDYLRGHLALLNGRRVDAEHLLLQAWRACDLDANARLGALVAAQLSQVCTAYARNPEAITWSERVLGLANDDARLQTAAMGTQLVSLIASGHPAEALRRALPQHATEQALHEGRFDDIAGRGLVRMWTDDLPGACADLAVVAQPGSHRRPLRIQLLALGYLAEAQFRAGDWDASTATGELAVGLAEDADHAWLLGFLRSTASLALSGRGQWEPARAHLQEAERAAASIGDVTNLAWTAVAATAFAHARRDHDAVLAATDVIAAMDMTHGALEPSILRWCPERIEALTARGRTEEAAALLDTAEQLARARHRRSALVTLGRARGVLNAAFGRSADATAAFDDAMASTPHLGMPFDTALLHLACGSHLRHLGRRRAAQEHLQTAADTFIKLGAQPYLERSENELTACGLRPQSRQPGPPSLTAREHAVARLVADGLTNREIAQRLIVSTKTVEYHLANAYTKLGVRNRAQLTAHLADAERQAHPTQQRNSD